MAKIYNEIIIDMNPESSSYGKTLHEDSFEYNGDMMLMQDPPSGFEASIQGWEHRNGMSATDYDPSVHTDIPAPPGYGSRDDYYKNNPNYFTETSDDPLEDVPVGQRTDIGEAPLTEAAWMDKTLRQQAEYLLEIKYAGEIPDEGEDGDKEHDLQFLMDRLQHQPLKGEIDPTKAGFLTEQYGGQSPYFQYDLNKDGKVDAADVDMAEPHQQQTISDIVASGKGDLQPTSFAESLAGRTAGVKKEKAMSTLRGQAGQVGQAMGSVYGGGTATGMRAGIAGQEAIGERFGTAQNVYGLDEDVAGLAYRKGMYGLEGETESAWEASWKTLYGSLPDAA